MHPSISHPELPRRRAPARFEIGNETPYFPETPKDLYRKVYFEALDLIIASIGERFDQPSFVVYKHMETLLIGFPKIRRYFSANGVFEGELRGRYQNGMLKCAFGYFQRANEEYKNNLFLGCP